MLEQAIPDALRNIAEPDSGRLRAILRQVEAHAERPAAKRPGRWLPLLLLGTAVSAAAMLGYQQYQEQEEPAPHDTAEAPLVPQTTAASAKSAEIVTPKKDDEDNRKMEVNTTHRPSQPILIYLR
jgi:hypothetical protein